MRIFIVACSAFFSTAAFAANEICTRIESDLDRLACYDKEAGRTPTAQVVQTGLNNWSISQERSAMRDTADIFVSTRSNEVINCRWNSGSNIGLMIRCMENTTAIYFSTGCHMTSSQYDRYGDIEYRVDQEKSRTVNGNASTDNRALGLWSGGKAIPVIKQLLGKSKLTVRMMPYGENAFTASFNIASLGTVIEPLRKACKW